MTNDKLQMTNRTMQARAARHGEINVAPSGSSYRSYRSYRGLSRRRLGEGGSHSSIGRESNPHAHTPTRRYAGPPLRPFARSPFRPFAVSPP